MVNKKNILIISSGSFEQSKKWVQEKLLKQSKNGLGDWNNCHFSYDIDNGSFDAVIKIGRINEDWHINCNPNNIISLHMEAYLGATYWHDWMVQGNEQCSHIISSYMGDKNGDKQIVSQACEPWYVEQTYTELNAMDIPKKTISETVSWITSNQMALPHHCYRMYFKAYVDKYNPESFDIFGRGIKSIDTKWETIAPYKYTMAIENACEPHAWTEKITDSLLGYSLPFYHGAPNIGEYFPEGSFVEIDIRNPEQTIEIIKKTIQDKQWQKSLPAIKQARKLILQQYQFMPYMDKFIDTHYVAGDYENITIKKHRPSFGVMIQQYLGKRIRSLGKKYWRKKSKKL